MVEIFNKIIIAESKRQKSYLFESLQDPITRFFFNDQMSDPIGEIDRFVNKDEFKQPAEFIEEKDRLADINLDTETDSVQSEKEPCCDSRVTKIKQLVSNEENPLVSDTNKK